MKKSKLMSIILALALTSMLPGCGQKTENASSPNTADNTKTVSDSKKVTSSDADIEILSCAFDNEVMGFDEELSSYGYTKIDGKVYVNAALKVSNNSKEAIGEDDISGYFEYKELRYDLQYDLASIAPTKHSDGKSILPGCVGIVNLLARVEEEAVDEDITVTLTLCGEERKEAVAAIDTRDALSKKTEVKAGDKFNVNNLYDIEVVECSEKKYLQTTNYKESEQYEALSGDKFIDLIIKVKNNTDVELNEIKGYVIINDEGTYAKDDIEVKDNTELKSLDASPLKAGEEEYIHISSTVDDTENTDGLAIRFNLAGNCYYCKVK